MPTPALHESPLTFLIHDPHPHLSTTCAHTHSSLNIYYSPYILQETFDPQFVSQEEEEQAAKALAKRRSTIKLGGGIQMALLNAGKLKVDNATSGIAGAFR